MAGLLDIPGFNPADFQVSDEERKRILLGNILLGISAGAMNARRGNELGAFGSGMLNGAAMGQQALGQAQAAKLDQLKAASGFMDLANKKRDYMTQEGISQAEAAYNPNALPTGTDLAPTPENAAKLGAPKTPFDALMAKAAYMDQKGYPQVANKYREEALKFAPKFKGMETVMDPKTGQPMLVQTYENQAPTASQYAPKPEMVSTDLGGKVVWSDKLRIPAGSEFAKSMTPGETASNQLGWANYGLSKQAADRAAANANGPQLVEGQWVYKPDASNPGGRAVPVTGMVPKPKELTESQGQASMYLGMMKSASDDLAKIKMPSSTALSLARGDVRGVPSTIQNWMASGDAQKYAQSSLQWTEAMLRITTGATAPPEEVARTAKTFFPQIGDSDAVKKQKEEKRKQMESLVRIKAGAGAGQVDSVLGGGWSITQVN